MAYGISQPDFVERLQLINDTETGVTGVIALHSTALGPAAGGCRLWHYASQEDMVGDAIRLARGMSYKNALAGLPFGGGKAVLQRPDGDFDRQAMFRVFGDAIASLDGAYVSAEDVGTGIADMQVARERTRYVAGLHAGTAGQAGGDPSPWTAQGVFEAMRATATEYLGLSVSSSRVAIQGAGSVGGGLCRLLRAVGAEVLVADVNADRARGLAAETGARFVEADAILTADADILAPCALGGILNRDTIPQLQVRLVCGGANNQFHTELDGVALMRRGILYTPDYVANAGGIINVAAEFLGESSVAVSGRMQQIGVRVLDVLRTAEERGLPPQTVADDMAREIIAVARRVPA
jgi:leucine dehydrogenase